jgi:hypothetical protein
MYWLAVIFKLANTHHNVQSCLLMMEAVRTSETSVNNHFTRQYNPEDNSEHHTHRRENLNSHERHTFIIYFVLTSDNLIMVKSDQNMSCVTDL